MSKYKEIFEYMRKCPQLAQLWSIAATEKDGVNVILPQGASPAVEYDDTIDVCGNYECTITPYPSVYEDFQINCYRIYDASDNSAPGENINVMTIDKVQQICDWVAEQNEKGELPNITGKKVVAIECVPMVPQVRGLNREENIIAYFVTIRIRYVNPIKRKHIEFDADD